MQTHHADLMVPTPFQDRLDALRTLFAPVGWGGPDSATDMAKADQTIQDALQDLRDQFTPPDDSAILEAAAKFAAGKGVSAARKVMEAPEQGPRFAALYKATRSALVRRYDTFPEADLVDAGAVVVADVLPAMADAALDTLRGLPGDVLEDLMAGRIRASHLGSVPVQDRPLEDVANLREAAAAWEPLYSLVGGGVTGRTAWSTMFAAVAQHTMAPRPTEFPEDLKAPWAVWMDSPAMVAIGAGVNPIRVLMEDMGSLSPLHDPFGSQRDVYDHRVRAAGIAEATMMTMTDTAAGYLYRNNPLMSRQAAQRRSASMPLNERVGLSVDQAVDAALREHPEYAQDPGELVPATDD